MEGETVVGSRHNRCLVWAGRKGKRVQLALGEAMTVFDGSRVDTGAGMGYRIKMVISDTWVAFEFYTLLPYLNVLRDLDVVGINPTLQTRKLRQT